MTLIIAEAGVNHNGDLNTAKKLVLEAFKAGADIVKFQTFNATDLTTSDSKKANYQLETTSKVETQQEMLSKLELKKDFHYLIKDFCDQVGIEFLSTGFDSKSIEFLATLDLFRWKVPSGEITNLPLLKKIAQYRKPIILSTGMANLQEIKDALSILIKEGIQKNLISILHCTTAYPVPLEEVNLNAISKLRESLNTNIGYSDHTLGIEVSIAAVGMGATIIEKHLTLDKNMPGPDHKASLEPHEFRDMVTAIRNIELAKGDGIKKATKTEIENMKVIRKSIVASRKIKKGELFNEDNLTTKRPGTGVSPMNWEKYLGKKSNRDYKYDEMIDEIIQY